MKKIQKNPSLKNKLKSIEPSRVFIFQEINDNAVELVIDRIGYSGTYSKKYAQKIAKELGHRWNMIFKR